MKVGFRTPSIKKSISARTTGKIKRKAKKAIVPGYGQKGVGWVTNPKKAAYNKVYNKATFGTADVINYATKPAKSNKCSNTALADSDITKVQKLLSKANKSAEILQTTTNPAKFFKHYDRYVSCLEKLYTYRGRVPFVNDDIGDKLANSVKNRVENIDEFIDRISATLPPAKVIKVREIADTYLKGKQSPMSTKDNK